ncbi:hypothetical protein Q8F55_005805 [Vanrija albida]|uniref:Uncharacterized protein n=1 Tax=Vanrija albida TaxID=181172 RepID=A0ABR3Q2N3_9TREE
MPDSPKKRRSFFAAKFLARDRDRPEQTRPTDSHNYRLVTDPPTLGSARSRASVPPTPVASSPPSPANRLAMPLPFGAAQGAPSGASARVRLPEQQQQPQQQQQQPPPQPPVYLWPVDTNLDNKGDVRQPDPPRQSVLYAAATDAEGFRGKSPAWSAYAVAARLARPPSSTLPATQRASISWDEQWQDVLRREEALARREEDVARREEQRARRESVLGHREDVVARREDSVGAREAEARRREEHVGVREARVAAAEADMARQRTVVDQAPDALAANQPAARSDPGHAPASDLPYTASAVSLTELERAYYYGGGESGSDDSLPPPPKPHAAATPIHGAYAVPTPIHEAYAGARSYGPDAYADDSAAIAAAYAAATSRLRSAPASRRESAETIPFPVATPLAPRVASVPLEAAARSPPPRSATLPGPTLYAPRPHHYAAHPPPILADPESDADGEEGDAPPLPPRPTGPPSLHVWSPALVALSADAGPRDRARPAAGRRTSASTDGSWGTKTPRPLSDLDDDAPREADSAGSSYSRAGDDPPVSPKGGAPPRFPTPPAGPNPPAPGPTTTPGPSLGPNPPAPAPAPSAISRGLTRLGAVPRGRRPAPPSASSRST